MLKDMLGNSFDNIDELTEFWGTTVEEFEKRYSEIPRLEYGLLGDKLFQNRKSVYDFLGNEYSSFKEMCYTFKVKPDIIRQRLNNKMTLKQAISSPIVDSRSRRSAWDKTGKVFKDGYKGVAEYYKISYHSLFSYINKKKMTLDEAIQKCLEQKHSKEIRNNECKKYKLPLDNQSLDGSTYETTEELCIKLQISIDSYNINKQLGKNHTENLCCLMGVDYTGYCRDIKNGYDLLSSYFMNKKEE